MVVPAEPKVICPLGYDTAKLNYLDPNFSWGLVEMDWNTGKVVPKLAERWEMVTPTQWRFYLRKDFKWQNGKPITAQDIAWNINNQTDPDAYDPSLTQPPRIQRYLKGKNLAKALDDYTVEINTLEPHLVLPNELPILNFHEPSSYLENPKICNEKPIGNGPYMLVKRVIGDYILWEANPYFAGEPAGVQIHQDGLPHGSHRAGGHGGEGRGGRSDQYRPARRHAGAEVDMETSSGGTHYPARRTLQSADGGQALPPGAPICH